MISPYLMVSPYYSTGSEELLLVALLALVLVLGNLWDFVRYSYEHSVAQAEAERLAPHPLQVVSAIAARLLAATAFPHAPFPHGERSAARPLMRRRSVPPAQRSGHRPVKPQQA